MKLTCAQMDVLISFYLEGDLSNVLKSKVEEHLKKCSSCRAKYDIIKSMLNDLRNCFDDAAEEETIPIKAATSQQYRVFKNNLSAYVDNELSQEENIKIKKFTINNKDARKDLEDAYNIRKIINESYQKTKNDIKQDFSRNVIKQLELKDEYNLNFHPILKGIFAFIMTVLSLSAMVIFSLTLS